MAFMDAEDPLAGIVGLRIQARAFLTLAALTLARDGNQLFRFLARCKFRPCWLLVSVLVHRVSVQLQASFLIAHRARDERRSGPISIIVLGARLVL